MDDREGKYGELSLAAVEDNAEVGNPPIKGEVIESGENIEEYAKRTSKIEVATSGPYRESLYGVRIPKRRLPAGEYILVASTHSPGLRGSFQISVWLETSMNLRP
jgi:hypothetical protein